MNAPQLPQKPEKKIETGTLVYLVGLGLGICFLAYRILDGSSSFFTWTLLAAGGFYFIKTLGKMFK